MQPASHVVHMPPYGGTQPCVPAPFYPHVMGGVIQPARDYVVWSLFNFSAFNCCCVGFAALIFSIKSRDCKVIGDLEGAASYGRTAKCLNIVAFILGIVVFFAVITGVATSRALISTKIHDILKEERDMGMEEHFHGK